MKKVRVNLGERSYDILIGTGIISKLTGLLKKLKLGKVAVVVTNPTINQLYGPLMKEALNNSGLEVHFEEVPDSEESKSARELLNLTERFADLDKGRGIFVVAFGGGVIGDLAGFAASIYRRGIPYIQVPTTLLAQVDSSIGGKVAIDLPCGKNLVGSFHQPRLVLSDMCFLSSLGPAQTRQALAEIIKYAVISDSRLFQFLEEHLKQILMLQKKELEYIIETCSKIKAAIVEQDETDKEGKRIILNFGHTTAHALEAACAYSSDYPHGYAVGLGILVAFELAKEMNLVSAETVKRVEMLVAKAGLPTKITGLKLSDILQAQAHDKKFSGGKNRFVLPLRIGRAVVKNNIPKEVIVKALKSRFSSHNFSLVDYE